MKRLYIAFLFLLLLASPSYADFTAGEKAFNERDFETAWKELHPLAESGDARAMEAVGCMYLDGNGVKLDYLKAIEWFKKAVEKGNTDAYNNLGFMYTEGLGVKKDAVKAFDCYFKAAHGNNYMAQATLAALYYAGIGVKKSGRDALKWFLIVSQNPASDDEVRESSLTKCAEIEKELTAKQIESAKAQAATFLKAFKTKKPAGE